MKIRPWWPGLTLAAVLALAWCVYHPGLRGGFLFDDQVNLPLLGATGPVDNWATLWRYLTSGFADPTGRPLALLSFLIDARNWPADPWPFKRTNVLLHLLNGALLAWVLSRLGRAALQTNDSGLCNTRSTASVDFAAVLAAGIWLLHPLFVSTVLYVVQREAMLPATFVMLGLLAWLHGRARLKDGALVAGPAWIFTGLGFCTLLATLCKGNGILLPLLAWVCEGLLRWRGNLIDSRRSRRIYSWLMIVLVGLPALLVAALLLQQVPGLIHGGNAGDRPWSVGQRLLTESRVLLDYLKLLWIPHVYTRGLFNDDITVSVSLLKPWTTLASVLAIGALVVLAWKCRRRYPFAACALLFFFTGQLLESTVIPLELYYEHRNYLPAMLMFWPLALWLTATGPLRRWRMVGATAILLGVCGMTWARANLWGDEQMQAAVWYQMNPHSPRAFANAIDQTHAAAHPRLAAARSEALLHDDPTEMQYAFALLETRCWLGGPTDSDLAKVRYALSHTQSHSMMPLSWIASKLDSGDWRACPGLNTQSLSQLLDSALRNPSLTGSPEHRREALYLKGRIALLERNPDQALRLFEEALQTDNADGAALTAAAQLGSAGYASAGLSLLDFAAALPDQNERKPIGMPRIHTWVLRRQHYWQNETARLRATLAEDAAVESHQAKKSD